LLIVVSILAALAVNEWREAHARAARAEEARAAFVHEIRANSDLLLSNDYLPHHKRLQTEYSKAANEGSSEPGSFFETGVHPAPLRDAAWRSFSGSTVLIDFPPEAVLLLSDIYRAQDSIEKRNDGFLNAIGTPRSDRETPAYAKDMTRSIFMYLNDLVPAEERLLKSYQHALEKLSPGKNDKR
jgi:hypothetical protein